MKMLVFVAASLLVISAIVKAHTAHQPSVPAEAVPQKKYGQDGGGIGPAWTWPKEEQDKDSQSSEELIVLIEDIK